MIEVRGWTTYGSVRGGCGHLHRTVEAAARCRQRDAHGCAVQGGYSDRAVMAVGRDGCLYRDPGDPGSWVPGPGGPGSGAARF
jgi:hypothetical protein